MRFFQALGLLRGSIDTIQILAVLAHFIAYDL